MNLFHRNSPDTPRRRIIHSFIRLAFTTFLTTIPAKRKKSRRPWLCNLSAFMPAPHTRVCEDRRATNHDLGCEMTWQKMSKCHRFGFLFWILLVGCASRPSSTDIHPGFALPVCSEVRWQGGTSGPFAARRIENAMCCDKCGIRALAQNISMMNQ